MSNSEIIYIDSSGKWKIRIKNDTHTYTECFQCQLDPLLIALSGKKLIPMKWPFFIPSMVNPTIASCSVLYGIYDCLNLASLLLAWFLYLLLIWTFEEKILQKEIFLHRIWAVSKLVLEKYRSVPSHCGLAFSSIFPSVNQSKQISVVDGCCRDLGISSSVLSVCIPLLSVTIPLC